ncbi:MAG: class I SAM-dependent methyltransferase [Desulfurococcaceae archaeon]
MTEEEEKYGKEYQERFGALDYEPFRLMRTFCRELIPPMKILIVGAANERQISTLMKRGDQVVAVDISEYACEISRKRCGKYRNYQVIQGDVRDLKFEPKTFDISFCRYLLEHYDLETDKKILSELCRVTKKFIIVGVSTTDVRPDRLRADPTHQTYLSFRAWTEFFKSIPFVKIVNQSRTKEAWLLAPVGNYKGLEEWV